MTMARKIQMARNRSSHPRPLKADCWDGGSSFSFVLCFSTSPPVKFGRSFVIVVLRDCGSAVAVGSERVEDFGLVIFETGRSIDREIFLTR